MCHKSGSPPISIIGLGLISVSSARRVPRPPARITTFTDLASTTAVSLNSACELSLGIPFPAKSIQIDQDMLSLQEMSTGIPSHGARFGSSLQILVSARFFRPSYQEQSFPRPYGVHSA